MTAIAFHFNAPDKLAYACRFARKAQRSGARLLIAAPEPALAALDRMLWALAPTDFVAHCRIDADPALLRASPLLLALDAQTTPQQELLLNLHAAAPEGFERFARLVEIVGAHGEADRALARARWRHYAALGHAITRHDLTQT